MEAKLDQKKADIICFYKATYNSWLSGKVLEFNPKSKELANSNSLDDFIKHLNEYSGNSLVAISDKSGFLRNEVLVFAKSNKLILTNKRYFISNENNICKQFDAYFLDKIKSIKRQGIFELKIILKTGAKMTYNFKGDWITDEGVEKAMNVIPEMLQDTFEDKSDLDSGVMKESEIDDVISNNQEQWECYSCGTLNSLSTEKCSNSKCNKVNENILVKFDEQINEYLSIKEFEKEIKSRNYNVSINTQIRKKTGESNNWFLLKDFSKGTKLEKLIHPIWASAKEYILYGIIFIMVLKAIDTTIFIFSIDIGIGIFWTTSLLLFAGMLFNKFSGLLAIGGIIFMQIKFGIQFNIFASFLTIGIIGVILGSPLGLAAGTIVGLIREKQGKKFIDCVPENRSVIVKGLVVPIVIFIILIILYFLVLNPWIIDLLEK